MATLNTSTLLEDIENAQAILEGIEAIAGSYLDDGLNSGLACDTTSIHALAVLGAKVLNRSRVLVADEVHIGEKNG